MRAAVADFTGDTKYYAALGQRAREQYTHDYAVNYRKTDELGVIERWETHVDLEDFLAGVGDSFARPIDVLDLGCGSGRYFHCFSNLKSLTGVDISPDMLIQAQRPVCAERIKVPITLLCANIFEIQFPAKTFDFIYAMGVVGRFMPVDAHFLERTAQMLRPGGKLAFSASIAKPLPLTWKRRMGLFMMPVLPKPIARPVQTRMRPFAVTEQELRARLNASPFTGADVMKRDNGTEFLVVAHKA
jgi:SAM-dependent methyltransferase